MRARRLGRLTAIALVGALLAVGAGSSGEAAPARTSVAVSGGDLLVNGTPTYDGRQWRAPDGRTNRVAGLLLNSRMANAVFDDANPHTAPSWAYPDTGAWDPARNTDELVAALPLYRAAGLLAIGVNLQGGSPTAYGNRGAWMNSAIRRDGNLDAAYMARVQRVIQAADVQGLVVVLGIFYFGQVEQVAPAAVPTAVDNVARWVLDHGFGNVIVEIDHECDSPTYARQAPQTLPCPAVHAMIDRVHAVAVARGSTLLAGASTYKTVPPDSLVSAADVVLLHGNGYRPAALTQAIAAVRSSPSFHGQPVVVNEDDHFAYRSTGTSNFLASVASHVSWGFFDSHAPPTTGNYTRSGGYQAPPSTGASTGPRSRRTSARSRRSAGRPPTCRRTSS